MASLAPSADQATDLIQKLSLDPQAKNLEMADPTQKTSIYQYGSANSGGLANGQVASYERSATPMLPEFLDPSMYYLSNGYPSPAYYFGGLNGTGNEYYDNSGFLKPEDMAYGGVYGDNGSVVYHHGYSYTPYGSYSPASTPIPTMANDGQLYGPQQYQYPSYFPIPTPTTGSFTLSMPAPTQGQLSATTEQKPLLVETANAAATVANAGVMKGNNDSALGNPAYQNQVKGLNNPYGKGALAGNFPTSGSQDPSFGYDGVISSVPASNGQQKSVSSNTVPLSSKASSFVSSRNQNYRSNSHFMGMQYPRPMSGFGTQGYINKLYPNKLYGQYGSNVRSGMGYGSSGYDTRTYGRGWLSSDGKYNKPRGRGYNYLYGNENMDGLNELNRGPRAKNTMNQNGTAHTTEEKKAVAATEEKNDKTSSTPEREQYNKEGFPEDYANAKFFVIKSYSEDDVHKSIKYNVWASTPNGNKKLDAAYHEAQQKSGGCSVFLFFSVNTSGQFVGMAEMVGPVDFEKNVEYWQQDKWTGSFPVNWHIVKDVPNSLLKHITLENNENKPVTNSRDTQEVNLAQGLKVLKIFKNHSSKTCILDDFEFYEARQKTIQEKKAKKQSQKLVWEGTSAHEKTNLAKESGSNVEVNNRDVKVSENGSMAKTDVEQSGLAEKRILANGC